MAKLVDAQVDQHPGRQAEPLSNLSLDQYRLKKGVYKDVFVCISGTASMAEQVNSCTDTSNGITGKQIRNVAVSCSHLKYSTNIFFKLNLGLHEWRDYRGPDAGRDCKQDRWKPVTTFYSG
jgi:hypothetical protein